MRNTREIQRRACEALLWWFRVLWEVEPVSGWTGATLSAHRYNWVGAVTLLRRFYLRGREAATGRVLSEDSSERRR